jgi:creatinine amidohydrolase/Fe(II)-dependent formamide hydrolase-like protein
LDAPERPANVLELLTMTWPQVEAYLQRARGVILPLGSIEQHGSAGLLGTDAICAEVIARRAAEIAQAILAPTVTLGMAQFNLGFPGTLSLRPSTLQAMLLDYISSLELMGFTHIYVLNGHGGNVAPARCAFAEKCAARSFGRESGGPLYCRLVNWWDPPPVGHLRRELYADAEGYHATPSEVAITMACHPGRVQPEHFPAQTARHRESAVIQHGGDPYFDAKDHRARYPDGRVGSNPSLANAADGQKLLAVAGEAIAEDYLKFVASH